MTTTRVTPGSKAIACAVLVLLLAAACSSDDGDGADTSALPDNPTTSTAADFSHLAKCDDYLGDGVILTAVAFDLAGCVTSDGQPAFYLPDVKQCADGRTLYSVDGVGWGYLDEAWHKDDSSAPPEGIAACQG